MDLADSVTRRIDRNLDAALRYVGDEWAIATRAEAAKEKIGRLITDIRFEPTGHGQGELVLTLYGRFVVTGSRPHTIVPRTARVLRFPLNGTTVYATRVHHPGTAPHPFPQRAWASSRVQAAKKRFPTLLFKV